MKPNEFEMNYFINSTKKDNYIITEKAAQNGWQKEELLNELLFTAYEISMKIKVFRKDNKTHVKIIEIENKDVSDKDIFIL
jgi:hypothetical protein